MLWIIYRLALNCAMMFKVGHNLIDKLNCDWLKVQFAHLELAQFDQYSHYKLKISKF